MPTTSTSSKSFPPFTIQLQQENTKENEWHKVEITKEDVSCIGAVITRLNYDYTSYTSILKFFFLIHILNRQILNLVWFTLRRRHMI